MDVRALPEEGVRWVRELGPVDLVVGIPSYRNAATIGYVVQQAAEGLRRHFPELRWAIVNADGGSPDGTREAVLAAAPADVPVASFVYQGPSGKGSAFRLIFEVVRETEARACVVVDSDLRSITPDWIRRLAGPVLAGKGAYVAPLYVRHKHDGTITNNVTYPMTRMLYGLDVRQPIGGDFGFSGRLAAWWLQQPVWETDVARFGIDIWMTTTAIAEGYPVVQAGLGLKIHDAKDPAASLGPMFSQVVGTLFTLMDRYADRWRAVREIHPAPLVGEPPAGEPEPVAVTLPLMVEKLREGLKAHREVLERVLPEALRRDLEALARAEPEAFAFPAELWARILFRFAVAHRDEAVPRDALMAALVPLYYGRTAGLVREGEGMDSATFEREVVARQAQTFWELKPELVALWEG